MRVRVSRGASLCRALWIAAAILAVVSPITAQSTAAPPAAPAESAPTPPSPDLRGLEPAVASQLAEARAALVAMLADAKSTPAARSSEWGTLGQLYHAYGLFDAAVVCYREAVRLAPTELQWHYLLGHAERGRSARGDGTCVRFARRGRCERAAFSAWARRGRRARASPCVTPSP